MKTTCTGCKFMLKSTTNDGGFACYRPKRLASGVILKPTTLAGFPIPFEIAAVSHYECRADGDNCGPERRNWEAA
jgi:hypothetical protein